MPQPKHRQGSDTTRHASEGSQVSHGHIKVYPVQEQGAECDSESPYPGGEDSDSSGADSFGVQESGGLHHHQNRGDSVSANQGGGVRLPPSGTSSGHSHIPAEGSEGTVEIDRAPDDFQHMQDYPPSHQIGSHLRLTTHDPASYHHSHANLQPSYGPGPSFFAPQIWEPSGHSFNPQLSASSAVYEKPYHKPTIEDASRRGYESGFNDAKRLFGDSKYLKGHREGWNLAQQQVNHAYGERMRALGFDEGRLSEQQMQSRASRGPTSIASGDTSQRDAVHSRGGPAACQESCCVYQG